MDEELFGDLMVSVGQAVEYSNGNKKSGRSIIMTLPDTESEADQLFFQMFTRLSESNKRKALLYVTELSRDTSS